MSIAYLAEDRVCGLKHLRVACCCLYNQHNRSVDLVSVAVIWWKWCNKVGNPTNIRNVSRIVRYKIICVTHSAKAQNLGSRILTTPLIDVTWPVILPMLFEWLSEYVCACCKQYLIARENPTKRIMAKIHRFSAATTAPWSTYLASMAGGIWCIRILTVFFRRGITLGSWARVSKRQNTLQLMPMMEIDVNDDLVK